MKKLLPILLLVGGFSSPAMADIIHTISASTQLRVDAAATDRQELDHHTVYKDLISPQVQWVDYCTVWYSSSRTY